MDYWMGIHWDTLMGSDLVVLLAYLLVPLKAISLV